MGLLRSINPMRWLLRHYFAGCALNALLQTPGMHLRDKALPGETVSEFLQRRSYSIADSMLVSPTTRPAEATE